MDPKMILLAAVVIVVLIATGIYVKGFKNWLVWAVTEAEATFGSGTGQLKLRYAYELAVNRFPIVAKLIPFSVFSKLVDEALIVMRKMIEDNVKIADAIVESEENAEPETAE